MCVAVCPGLTSLMVTVDNSSVRPDNVVLSSLIRRSNLHVTLLMIEKVSYEVKTSSKLCALKFQIKSLRFDFKINSILPTQSVGQNYDLSVDKIVGSRTVRPEGC